MTMDSEENDLIIIAQWSESDELAKLAMKKLKEEYDDTYFYCEDCGEVCKLKDCCNNK